MPRIVRYVKDVGTLKKGYEEERSDIDANILSALGVIEILPIEAETEEDPMPPKSQQGAGKMKRMKQYKKRTSKNSKEGYKRRDMTPEQRT